MGRETGHPQKTALMRCDANQTLEKLHEKILSIMVESKPNSKKLNQSFKKELHRITVHL
jgi:hypothetical protein